MDDQGRQRIIRSRFVVDAGGHRSQQYNRFVGERVYSEFFRNVALYTYFENGKRLPPPNEGNILSCAFADGWFWYIPLSSSLTSVGAVVSREVAQTLQIGHKEAFAQFVAACPMIADYLANARPVTEGIYGEYRVRKDYSYSNTRFSAPGLVLVGDAACFIDPVFSSGVHLATYSALLAARSVNTVLEGAIEEEGCFAEYERRYRREFGNFYQFLVAFYDMHQDAESYFWSARKILNTEERANDAFVRLVAGLSSDEEPLFTSPGFFSARVGFGAWFEEMLSNNEKKWYPKTTQFDGSKFDPARFMLGFTEEIAQVQLQALYGGDRPKERPLVKEGLVPSRDGFRWTLAS